MALDIEAWRKFIQEHLPTALVVGFAVSGITWGVNEKIQEKQLTFLNGQIASLRQDTINIDQLKTRVKQLEEKLELFEEQRRRKDDMLPSIARFDPKQLYSPSTRVTIVEATNAK
jgi:Tfp pilus assembly protein PilN